MLYEYMIYVFNYVYMCFLIYYSKAISLGWSCHEEVIRDIIYVGSSQGLMVERGTQG